MLALERKRPASRAAAPARQAPQRHTRPRNASPVVQRAPSCACGGSCPDCQAKTSRIGVVQRTDAAKVPAAPVNEFEDCPRDWQQRANAALVIARRWVANVVTGLSNLTFPYPAGVSRLLNRHFRITGRGYLHEVRRHFATIHAALNSPIDFECEKSCDAGVAAYVYTIWSDVHLCPVWYAQTPDGRANTIIHEIAHDAANRDDEAYVWEASYPKLSVEDAIDNADSYSNFAQESYSVAP